VKLVCAPDSLKGVLAAPAAARALADGASRAGADPVELPLADGGEGTAEVLHEAWGGTWRTTNVVDPLGRERTARFLYVEDRRLAVVETAEAIGLPLLAEQERDPLKASSEGLALLIRGALAVGARELLVTLGGSATVDGGAGLSNGLDSGELAGIRVTALCDVTNPLHGPRGAARAFGPQKGATEADVLELERRLRSMSHLTPYAELGGAGAAGGLGAALASLGATLAPGASAVLNAVDFDTRVAGSDLVVTGEGRVDATSLEGKVPASVAAACEALKIPCVVFGGQIDAAGKGLYARGATALFALSGQPQEAVEDLERLGYGLARLAAGLRRG
jgi:glycerate kinase